MDKLNLLMRVIIIAFAALLPSSTTFAAEEQSESEGETGITMSIPTTNVELPDLASATKQKMQEQVNINDEHLDTFLIRSPKVIQKIKDEEQKHIQATTALILDRKLVATLYTLRHLLYCKETEETEWYIPDAERKPQILGQVSILIEAIGSLKLAASRTAVSQDSKFIIGILDKKIALFREYCSYITK